MSNPFEALERRLTAIEDHLTNLTTTLSIYVPQKSDRIEIEEVAEMLGISVKTVYNKTSAKEIPFSKVEGSKRLIFSKKQIEAYIANGHIKTIREQFRESERLISERIARKKEVI